MALKTKTFMGGIISYFARHGTIADLLLAVMIILGLVSITKIRAQFFPDVIVETVSVKAEEKAIQTHPILGYWISDDTSYILKIEETQSSFRFLNRAAAQNGGESNCPVISLDEMGVTLNCDLTKNQDFKMIINENGQLITTRADMPGFLKRPPNLNINQLTGLWRDEESNGKGHTIFITNRDETGYVLESYDLYKHQKSYNYYLDKKNVVEDVKLVFLTILSIFFPKTMTKYSSENFLKLYYKRYKDLKNISSELITDKSIEPKEHIVGSN